MANAGILRVTLTAEQAEFSAQMKKATEHVKEFNLKLLASRSSLGALHEATGLASGPLHHLVGLFETIPLPIAAAAAAALAFAHAINNGNEVVQRMRKEFKGFSEEIRRFDDLTGRAKYFSDLAKGQDDAYNLAKSKYVDLVAFWREKKLNKADQLWEGTKAFFTGGHSLLLIQAEVEKARTEMTTYKNQMASAAEARDKFEALDESLTKIDEKMRGMREQAAQKKITPAALAAEEAKNLQEKIDLLQRAGQGESPLSIMFHKLREQALHFKDDLIGVEKEEMKMMTAPEVHAQRAMHAVMGRAAFGAFKVEHQDLQILKVLQDIKRLLGGGKPRWGMTQ